MLPNSLNNMHYNYYTYFISESMFWLWISYEGKKCDIKTSLCVTNSADLHASAGKSSQGRLSTRARGLGSENTLNTIIIHSTNCAQEPVVLDLKTLNTIIIQQINLTSVMLCIETTGLKFTVQKPWTSLSHPNYSELVRNSSLLVSSWHFLLGNKIR